MADPSRSAPGSQHPHVRTTDTELPSDTGQLPSGTGQLPSGTGELPSGTEHPHVRTTCTGQLPSGKLSCTSSSSMGATTGTGLAKSEITPGTLQQQEILINTQGRHKSSTITVSKGTLSEPMQSGSMATSKIPSSLGPSPRKKVKLEEKSAANEQIEATRNLLLDERYVQMRGIKENYIEHLTECFYLQSGLNLMDFHSWKEGPTPQLVQFLKSGRLDSDDDEENPLIYLQEKEVRKEVKTRLDNLLECSCFIEFIK